MLRLCLLLTLVVSVVADYRGYKVLVVHPQTSLHRDVLMRLANEGKIDIWKADEKQYDIFVAPEVLSVVQSFFQESRMAYDVSAIDVAEDVAQEAKRLANRSPSFNYEDFNDLKTINSEIDRLASKCISGFRCSIDTIGMSIESRQIRRLKIKKSGNSTQRVVWIDGMIHAREWLTTATMMKIIRHMIDNYDSDKDVKHLLDTYEWHFLPVVNPDGYEFSWASEGKNRMFRKNKRITNKPGCIGVDLNRNAAYAWATAGSSAQQCSQTYHGSHAASEPEIIALQKALHSLYPSLIHFISLHTYGNYWLTPFAAIDQTTKKCLITKDDAESKRVADAAANAIEKVFNTKWLRGEACKTIYPASGSIMDYAKAVAGVKYGAVPELRGPSFVVPPSAIDLSFKELWPGVVASMKAIERAV